MASETQSAMRRIFDMFDVDRNGRIDKAELKTIMKSIGLYPSPTEIKEIIAQVDTNNDGVIDFSEFCAMRRGERAVEFNVLAEFKKFDVDWLHRGFVTVDAIERVLEDEGYSSDAIERFTADFMSCDSNSDGLVSYRDLHERMMGRIPEAWLDWLAVNVERGVADATILEILQTNGFRNTVSMGLLERTKREGRLPSEVSFVDHAHYSVYNVRS